MVFQTNTSSEVQGVYLFMSVTFYWYPKCGTCRNAQKWLNAHGVSHDAVDIVIHPPGADELRKMVVASGLGIQKFFNTSGEVYRELQLKDKLPALSESEKLQLLASNGKLIKRPLVTDGSKVTVGFREDEFQQAWAKA
jgi:arsenate reductase (glutaredoxin)